MSFFVKHIAVLLSAALMLCSPLSLYADGLDLNTPKAKPSQPEDKHYEVAYNELAAMLAGKEPLSIRRAVFLAEWAYLDGKPDYKDYCLQIDTTAQALKRFVAANQLDRFKTGLNVGLFEYFSRPYSMNGYRPFTYDFDDFGGTQDLTKLFVTKVMLTHSGQCHSLPFYYKVLAEAIGAEAYVTFAPQHVFIRHRDENDPGKWVNVELTTQSLSRELFYIESFGITDDAIRSKLYLYPLTDSETVAYLLSWLAMGYQRKYGAWDDFMLRCADKSLEYYPQDVAALRAKCNAINTRLVEHVRQNGYRLDDVVRTLDSSWHECSDRMKQLGWTENILDATYLGILRGVEELMKAQGIDSLTIQTELDRQRKIDGKQQTNKPH